MSAKRMRPARERAFVFLAILFGVVLVECGASLVLFCYYLLFNQNAGLASRKHVQYDSVLGWINVPGLELPDFYGPDASLLINGQSFRHQGVVTPQIPPGKLRIVCAGDSFTLGIGVGDEQTWCRLLESRNPRFESVNFGEAGYGLDQIYLKYEDHAQPLDHDVLLFAFIEDSFRRMRSPHFLLYKKPLLRLEGQELRRTHIPVPQTSRLLTWLGRNDGIIGGLRMVSLGRRIGSRFAGEAQSQEKLTEDETRAVVGAIFDRIQESCRERDCVPMFVFLKQDLKPNPGEREWREFLTEELGWRGMAFLDLAQEMNDQRAKAKVLWIFMLLKYKVSLISL